MNILYVHGFGGSGDGASSQLIKNYLKENGVEFNFYAPTIQYLDPRTAVASIKLYRKYYDIDIIIASSLGAFFSSSFDCPKILINPGLPKDVINIFPEADDRYIADLNYVKSLIDKGGKCVDNTYLVFGDKDVVCNNKDYYLEKYSKNNCYSCDMEHKLSDSALPIIGSIITNMVKGKLDETT